MAIRGSKKQERKNRPKTPPRQKRTLSGRFFRGGMLLLLGIGAGFYIWQYGTQAVEIPEVEVEPVTSAQLIIDSDLTHVSREQIDAPVDELGKVGMLALDTEALRMALEALPWVHRASVRKIWPDRIRVAVSEQRAAVLWGVKGYLNLDGVYFDADGISLEQPLPLITSTQEDTVAVYQQLLSLSAILAQEQWKGVIQEMVVDRRGAVTLHLKRGLLIHLGRRAVEQRLKRWVAQAAVVMERFEGKVRGVDLRYERGMVLQLKEGRKRHSVKG